MAKPCDPPLRLPKNFLRPCLLLLLKEQTGYGYDLVARLRALGIVDEPAAVYRALRSLEEQRAVSSTWCTSSTGPARRMYALTPTGEDRLQAAVGAVVEAHQAIERFFCRHALARTRSPEPDGGGPAVPSTLRRLVAQKGLVPGVGDPT